MYYLCFFLGGGWLLGLQEVFKHHTWVGLANADLAILQHRTKLYLCKIRPLR